MFQPKERTEEEIQCDELDIIVKTKLAPSKIHGVGLFALDGLKKGERLYANNFPKVYIVPYSSFHWLKNDVAEELLTHWPSIVNGSKFAYPTTKLQAFINHSEDPNYDFEKDEMLKVVDKGEEITMNYKLIPNYEKIYSWLK